MADKVGEEACVHRYNITFAPQRQEVKLQKNPEMESTVVVQSLC